MHQDRLLDVVGKAGKLLIESGAEIYRVEETMLHLARSFEGVEEAQSYVSATGLMLSIKIDNKNATKIFRVSGSKVNLDRIAAINALSREASVNHYSVDEVEHRLNEIENMKEYPWWVLIIASGFGAAGFAGFFRGNTSEILITFIIGIIVASIVQILKKLELNSFFVNAISAGILTILSQFASNMIAYTSKDILIISSIMLLVPGLAITNAIRDMFHGDFVSGTARMMEAFLCAIGIACGVCLVFGISMG